MRNPDQKPIGSKAKKIARLYTVNCKDTQLIGDMGSMACLITA
ncbi:MAG: hypothetical protein JWP44_4724 [Mucilaginibacter sp.]|nr:hypothetical protein [Mucilaginibacter sp.]